MLHAAQDNILPVFAYGNQMDFFPVSQCIQMPLLIHIKWRNRGKASMRSRALIGTSGARETDTARNLMRKTNPNRGAAFYTGGHFEYTIPDESVQTPPQIRIMKSLCHTYFVDIIRFGVYNRIM